MKRLYFFEITRHMVRTILKNLPFLRKLELSLRYGLNYKNNFGKIKFQGQFFQDMIAYLYLQAKINDERERIYIDIGANNGIGASNTYIFEQLGWKGICIEPQPDIFRQLKKYRKCDCYNVALSSQSNNEVKFVKINAFNGSLSGFYDGISESHKDWAKKTDRVEYINVKTMTFEDIMKNYPNIKHIDFMSIDVEGHEMAILKTIDFSKYTFGFITIEKNESSEEIRNIMEQNGYKYFMEVGDDIMFVPIRNSNLRIS
jgi:FkbM family methyltransferase